MFICKFLDFPKIPKELIDTVVPGEVIREYPGRTCTKNNIPFNTSFGIYYKVNNELTNWVKENIPVDLDFVGIRYQFGSAETPSQGVHTDATRDYGILYVVDTAGGHLEFWQKKGQDLEFDEHTLVNNYDELNSLGTVATPIGSWYLVNGRVLHSVENILSKRVTIQINLKSLDGITVENDIQSHS
jgi:hypothetical protein